MNTHGFFEIAMVAGYLAAVIYVSRLWSFRRDRRLRIPFYVNLGMVALPLMGILSVLAWKLVN